MKQFDAHCAVHKPSFYERQCTDGGLEPTLGVHVESLQNIVQPIVLHFIEKFCKSKQVCQNINKQVNRIQAEFPTRNSISRPAVRECNGQA